MTNFTKSIKNIEVSILLLEFMVLGWRLENGKGIKGLFDHYGCLHIIVKLDYYPSFTK